jgi:hypothetical protein
MAPIVPARIAKALSRRAASPCFPLPKRNSIHSAAVITPERLCHFPMKTIMNANTSTTPPRISTQNPLTPMT